MRKLMVFMLAVLICVPVLFGNPVWDGDGTYYFDSGTLVETAVSDSATLYMSGGEITSALLCLDQSTLYKNGGYIDRLSVRNSSEVNLRGGVIDSLSVDFPGDNLQVKLYVNQYLLEPDSYLGYDNLSGIWLDSGETFEMLLVEGSFQYLEFIPEPCTILLFTIIIPFLKK